MPKVTHFRSPGCSDLGAIIAELSISLQGVTEHFIFHEHGISLHYLGFLYLLLVKFPNFPLVVLHIYFFRSLLIVEYFPCYFK